jgi:hypothetical protein
MPGYFDPQYGWQGGAAVEPLSPEVAAAARARLADALTPDQSWRTPTYPGESMSAPSVAVPAGVAEGSAFRAPVVAAPAPAPAPPPTPQGFPPDNSPIQSYARGPLRIDVDRSRGLSGNAWAEDTGRRHGDTEVVRGPDHVGAHTQGELEGMANARRLLDEAYGPTHEAFDPVEAQVQSLGDQAKLKIAEARAADPVGFSRMQAEIPEQAKADARLNSGVQLAGVFGKFDNELQGLAQKRAAMKASPEYLAAKPEARAAADARLDAEETRLHSNLRVLQQAMGFTTGQTPSSLFAEQRF